ncbi:MAG: isoleucyl-tRNA synthetase [Sphingomonadales bacterium]|jgi:isoleucyl-tRNA synthetase|nr:isoleucyl-tRNA synthetase [Sphingomonadales bacterium]
MSEKPDYRATVFLPKTDFPMKAGLASKEPAILARWAEEGLYQQIRAARAGRTRFILHDGPPYANGDLHMGHAMNKILKDIVVRSASLRGFDAPYIPGWDCHGLPIEWKVEEQYRKKKLDKDEVPKDLFRAECRAYAEKWVAIQSGQFQRLGVMGEWDDPYLTMKYQAEAKICEELLKFAESGQLYRGAKPVMWSPVEKTALAEAEVEYEDIVSTQIDVGFEITESPIPELVGASAIIWTTTPWTIPVNQAIAYGPDVEYVVLPLDDKRVLVAEALVPHVLSRHSRESGNPVPASGQAEKLDSRFRGNDVVRLKGSDLAGTVARHPMHHLGGFFARPRAFLPAEHVTTDAGTGLVHMSPDHGEEDFLVCKAAGIDPVFAVEDDGKYRNDWLWLGGLGSVINNKFNAPDGPICNDLREAGALLAASADFHHSYPHSWRSKAKVIYRCTPQWFIPMDQATASLGGNTLRQTALDAIDETRWVPEKSKNRIRAMVEGRPDWVISRQRAWGVPIALYVERGTGEYLKDAAVNSRIIRAFHEGGADAWFSADHQALLGNGYRLEDYEPQMDILDVWFDSGSTHAYVIEARYGEDVRADLYLEGSDQHRGWFQSSLMESSGTRGRAPFKSVLTHGFALDGNGRKMSKSDGNVVDPLAIIRDNGADILRLWVASTDYFEDVRIGKEVLSGTSDAYRKLRNTFRYLLGALDGFSDVEKVPAAEMPELERWVLHRLAVLDAELKEAAEGYEFNRYARALMAFANDDLSAFFFDIRKDSLYCDAPAAPKRRAYRTVLDVTFQALVRWLSPVLCFTTEEVWGTRYPEAGSVHLLEWPEIDAAWRDEALAAKWALIRATRERVTESIEPLRRDKAIGSSLEARVAYPDLELGLTREALSGLAEICIVSEIVPGEGEGIEVTRSAYLKCGRCWRLLPEVGEEGGLCARCEGVVNG